MLRQTWLLRLQLMLWKNSHLPLQQEQGHAVDQPAYVHFDVVSDVLWKIFINSSVMCGSGGHRE
jgi:hypothetical protein